MADKKDWYAIAQEAEEEERQKAGDKPKPAGKRKPVSPAARKEWYEAAGEEAPPEEAPPPPSRSDKGRVKSRTPEREYIDVSKENDLLQVSAGRRDPPWGLIGGVAAVLCFFGLAFWVAGRSKPAQAQDEDVNLPIKNIKHDISYGFLVTPADGFKEQVVSEPEWLQGIHGETYKRYYFKNSAAGVEAYYFGELKKETTLDQYVAVGTDLPEKGKVQPIQAIPEGMSKYPSKGFLVEFGDRKGLYFASQDKDIFVSVYAVTSKANFDKAAEAVQEAVRGLKVEPPTGPHPDKAFATKKPGE